MMSEYKKRLTDFLLEYVDIVEEGSKQEEVIKAAIKLLVTEKVFTVDEMRKTAVRDHSVLIPASYIRECVYG